MPFGLTRAASSFQWLMDKIMWGLPFVMTYLDDVLIHSENEEQHRIYLQEIFKCLSEAGLTLRGYASWMLIKVEQNCSVIQREYIWLLSMHLNNSVKTKISPCRQMMHHFSGWPPKRCKEYSVGGCLLCRNLILTSHARKDPPI